jgi:zinc protease
MTSTKSFSTIPNLRCQRAVLENGLVVLVTENPVADIIAARLFVDAGGCHENPEQSGLSHLAAALLVKGTLTLTAQGIATQVESTGASLGVDSTPDYFLCTLKTVSADFVTMLQLAADLIQVPTFPEFELELERQLMLQAIRARQEQPLAIALQQLRQSMYLNHPYGQSGLGTLESVTKIQRSHLETFHKDFFRPDKTTLSIAGNITLEQLMPALQKIFGQWKGSDCKPKPLLHESFLASTPVRSIYAQANQQSIVMLGYPAPAVHEKDYPALKLLSTYLWNGLSSRLFTELREKKGLAYEVSGFYPTRRDTSHFVAYLGTASKNTDLALGLLQSELERLCDQPLSQQEIEAAKRKLLGQYALGKQTNQQIAQIFGWYEYLQLGVDYDQTFMNLIQAVTSEQAHQAAIQHLSHPFISLVGPEDAVTTV